MSCQEMHFTGAAFVAATYWHWWIYTNYYYRYFSPVTLHVCVGVWSPQWSHRTSMVRLRILQCFLSSALLPSLCSAKVTRNDKKKKPFQNNPSSWPLVCSSVCTKTGITGNADNVRGVGCTLFFRDLILIWKNWRELISTRGAFLCLGGLSCVKKMNFCLLLLVESKKAVIFFIF